MMDGNILEDVYKEGLEEDIIAWLAADKHMSFEDAMDIYYRSKLSEKIQSGSNGVQYLDYKNLAEILLKTEVELFDN